MIETWQSEIDKELSGTRLRTWRLAERISAGFSGVVFRALTETGNESAIKIYNPALFQGPIAENNLRRFEQQRTLIDHKCPYLVQIHDVGTTKVAGREFRFVVMEHVRGRVLTTALGRIPMSRITALIAQIAEAAHYLESIGFVHRDIKPSNVIVSRDNARATLLDVGYMRALNARSGTETSSASDHMTVRYTPPEILDCGAPGDTAAWRAVTFYQLGLLIHELLSKRRVHDDLDDEMQLPARILNGVPALDVDPRHEALYSLSRKCLATAPKERRELVNWASFENRRGYRRPTILFLYTGGTIGSGSDPADGGQRLRRVIDSRHAALLERLQCRVMHDYSNIYGRNEGPLFDIQWEIIPADEQLLSENATQETWNTLATSITACAYKYVNGPAVLASESSAISTDSKLADLFSKAQREYTCHYGAELSEGGFADSLQGRYILGMVVLHGTDTLAYSAAALTFALSSLPFPIVLTGANQPPNESEVNELDFLASSSDAWRNLLRSVHFLVSFGHRYSELFVCFGDTVHHGLNLRKLAIEESPTRPAVVARSAQEPFCFKNLALLAQYMFKFIDGSYCNNFYPIRGEILHETLVRTTAQSKQPHHIRSLSAVDCAMPEPRRFSSHVRFVTLSPLPVDIDIDAMVHANQRRDGTELRVLLVEGYPSATLPTAPHHHAHQLLSDTLKHGVPIVLVSRSGNFPDDVLYSTHLVDGARIPVCRLYRIIHETALPLLSLIVGAIPESEWYSGPEDNLQRLEHRHIILRRHLQNYLCVQENIVGWVLGNVASKADQRNRLERSRGEIEERREYIAAAINDSTPSPKRLHSRDRGKRVDGEGSSARKSWVTFSRNDFLSIRQQYTEPRAAVGGAPDSFALHYDMGKAWARTQIRDAMVGNERKSRELLSGLVCADQLLRCAAIQRLPRRLGAILWTQGIARVRAGIVNVCRDEQARQTVELSIYSGFCFDIRIGDRNPLIVDGELFTVHGWGTREREFIRALGAGASSHEDLADYSRRINAAYGQLFEETWVRQLSVVEWFILGAFKAVASYVARHLLIDTWTRRIVDAGDRSPGEERLGAAINLELRTASGVGVEARFTYDAVSEDS